MVLIRLLAAETLLQDARLPGPVGRGYIPIQLLWLSSAVESTSSSESTVRWNTQAVRHNLRTLAPYRAKHTL